jgi:hypothetical protein
MIHRVNATIIEQHVVFKQTKQIKMGEFKPLMTQKYLQRLRTCIQNLEVTRSPFVMSSIELDLLRSVLRWLSCNFSGIISRKEPGFFSQCNE